MMKLFNKNILTLFALVLLMVSCNDEFLEKLPETEIGRENFFRTATDLEIYVNSMYNFPNSWIYSQDVGTDNRAGSTDTEIAIVMAGNATAENITTGWDWEELRNINYFLDIVQDPDYSSEATQEELEHYTGIARFFRAQFYMEKVKRYSDVPWYGSVITAENEEALFKERDSRSVVVDHIFEDYQYAADHVFVNGEVGAVNNDVVRTFMARSALYEGTFRKYHGELDLQSSAEQFLQLAAEASQQVMDGGRHAIYSTGNPGADYLNLFISNDLSGNPEIILPRIFEFNLVNSGWGLNEIWGDYGGAPTRDLTYAYLMTDGSYVSSIPDYETMEFVEQFQDRDPRMWQTYTPPGFDLYNVQQYSPGGENYVQNIDLGTPGYHQVKGFVNSPDNQVASSLDIPVLRYAEVLLINAEAKAELGTLTQFDLDQTINLLRDRVELPHLTMNPEVDPYQQAKFPEISNTVLLEIRRERRVELAQEGFRMDDLMRWHAGKLMEEEPTGIYFPGLGDFDLTGDGIPDVRLIEGELPTSRETNELGTELIYYRVSEYEMGGTLYLENGVNGGVVVVIDDTGTFEEPKHYYRPVPGPETRLNPNLTQIFGW